MSTDEQLLDLVQRNRDAVAFNELAQRHMDMVYATCLRVLGNVHDAQDVAQTCFLELARKRPPVRTLGGWLHALATSRAIDRIRGDQRRRNREQRYADETAHAAPPEWDDIQAYVDEAIAALPDSLRDPIVLHFLERRSQKAIAIELGVSQSAVSQRIAKGLDRIRADLREQGIDRDAVTLGGIFMAAPLPAAPAELAKAIGRLALSGVGSGATATSGGLLSTLSSGATAAGRLLLHNWIVTTAAVVTLAVGAAVVPQAVQHLRDGEVPGIGGSNGGNDGSVAGLLGPDETESNVPPQGTSAPGSAMNDDPDDGLLGGAASVTAEASSRGVPPSPAHDNGEEAEEYPFVVPGDAVQIIPGPGNTVSVLADYAPVDEVLSALALREGTQAVFPKRLHSRVLLTNPDNFRPPADWISQVVRGMNLIYYEDNGVRRFGVRHSDHYDGTLTSAEVVEKYRRASNPSKPAQGITHSLLILHGEFIPPPYEITISDERGLFAFLRSEDEVTVMVNGLPLLTLTDSHQGMPDLPSFEEVEGGKMPLASSRDVYYFSAFVGYPHLRAVMDQDSALRELAVLLEKQEIVEKAFVTDEHPRIWVTFFDCISDPPLRKPALPENYNLDTAEVRSTGGVGATLTLREQAKGQADFWRSQLDNSKLIIRGSTGEMHIRAPRRTNEGPLVALAEIIQKSMDTDMDVLDMECMIADVIEERQLAREIAANNFGADGAPLLEALEAIIHDSE